MLKKLVGLFSSKDLNVQKSHRYALTNPIDMVATSIEQKSFSGSGNYVNMLESRRQCSLAAYVALDYYAKIQPVNSSIDMITEELASIDPVVINTQTDEFDYDHNVLTLLNSPNPFCRYNEFIKSVVQNYLVTGNAFIIVNGNLKEPAKEMYDINPRYIQLETGADGYITEIRVQQNNIQKVYYRQIDLIQGRRVARYIHSSNSEIFHIKNNNPYGYSDSPWGFSRLTSIVYEMEQYLHSNMHNLSLLVKGGRPSMGFVPEDDLTDEQFASLQQQIQAYVAGSSNAGTIVLFPRRVKGVEMSVSNKDMDYESLRRNIISAIHTQLGVPLPLVMAEQMTLANMQSAIAQFYQNTVIPVANRIFTELTDMLMTRYDDRERMIISFDRRSIPALEFESVESVKMKASLNVMTDNEIRTDIGLEHVEGGDVLYKPSNLVPTGKVELESDQDEKQNALSYMVSKLQAIKDNKGARVYSDERIKLLLEKHNLT